MIWERLLTVMRHPWANDLGWILIHCVWIAALAAAAGALAVLLLDPSRARWRCGIQLTLLIVVIPAAVAWHATHREQLAAANPERRGATRLQEVEGRSNALREPHGEQRSGSEESVAKSPSAASGAGGADVSARDAGASRTAASHARSDGEDGAKVADGLWLATWEVVRARLETWLPMIVLGWAVGVTLATTRLTAGWILLRSQLNSTTSPVSQQTLDLARAIAGRLGIHEARRIGILESTLAGVPATIGWLRPLVVLPAALLTNQSTEELEAILAHELAHVRRFDFLANTLQAAVETLLFFHPAIWWLGARVRVERERACDDLAMQATGDRAVYVRAMTNAAEHAKRHALALAAANGRSSEFVSRMRRLLQPAAPQRVATHVSCLAIWAMLVHLLVLPLGFIEFATAELPDTPPSASAGRVFQGVVADSQGSPVAGAVVQIVRRSAPHLTANNRLAKATTDTQGKFLLRLSEWPRIQGRPAPLQVLADAADFAPTWSELEPPASPLEQTRPEPQPDGAAGRLKLTLAQPVSFRGVIVDEQDRPLDGAKVRLLHLMPLDVLQKIDIQQGVQPHGAEGFLNVTARPDLGSSLQTQSNARGEFQLEKLPRNIGFAIEIDHPRFQRTVQFGTTSERSMEPIRAGKWVGLGTRDASEVASQSPYVEMLPIRSSGAKIAMAPGASVRIRAVDGERGPVKGIRLRQSNPLAYYSPLIERVTEADGVCEFTQLTPHVSLRVSLVTLNPSTFDREQFERGNQRAWLAKPLTIAASDITLDKSGETPGQKEKAIDMVLTSATVLTGVVHSAQGKLVPNVHLSCVRPEESEARPALQTGASTDERGQYFMVAPIGTCELKVRNAPAGFQFDREAVLGKVELMGQHVGEFEFNLQPIPPLVFEFVDEQGRAVAIEADVRAYNSTSSYATSEDKIREGLDRIAKVLAEIQ